MHNDNDINKPGFNSAGVAGISWSRLDLCSNGSRYPIGNLECKVWMFVCVCCAEGRDVSGTSCSMSILSTQVTWIWDVVCERFSACIWDTVVIWFVWFEDEVDTVDGHLKLMRVLDIMSAAFVHLYCEIVVVPFTC